jgi:hypothetical protein
MCLARLEPIVAAAADAINSGVIDPAFPSAAPKANKQIRELSRGLLL